jgi:TrmH family RNA methyltransferase
VSGLSHINIVLVRPQQPGNIGVAARAIANHGIGQLSMVCPAGFDPERARWMAPKSHHVIDNARYCSTISEAVAGASRVIATTARPRSQDLPVHTPEDLGRYIAADPIPTAILFGPEDSGLSNDDLFLVESLLHFPTTEVSSINLGQAVTATATALAMGHRGTEPRPTQEESDRAPAERREDLVIRTLGVLNDAGYLDGRSRPIVANTLIRLAARTDLSQEEVGNLLGMIKHVDWWLKEQSK